MLSLPAVLLAVAAAAAAQFPLNSSASSAYQFKWPIRNVAIVGAGPSGLLAYRELTRAGLRAHIFERDHVPGGNWHYTEETPPDAPIPNADIAVGDYVPSLPATLPYEEHYDELDGAPAYAALRREHRGPKPVWESLMSNAPAPIQEFPELPWPAGTEWELSQHKMQKYVRAFASFHGLNSNDGNPDVSYNTRVERVEKRVDTEGRECGWTLTLKRLVSSGPHMSTATWWTEDFDAIVVATGRFNAPYIPPIPGAATWADRFPGRIMHARQYRRPEQYVNETILIVGAATSGGEISRDLNPFAHKIYQSIRPDKATVPHLPLEVLLHRLPENTTIVSEIKQFHEPSMGEGVAQGRIELKNGTILTGVDRVIFATGFRFSFPFLPQYHGAPGDDPRPLVTDGTHLRALYLDLFFIEEPTIGFLSMNHGIQVWTYAEYLALALAQVWAGNAALPAAPTMWQAHERLVQARGGYTRHLQFLGTDRTVENVRFFVGWLNAAAARNGGRQIGSLPPGYTEVSSVWAKALFGSDIFAGGGDFAPPVNDGVGAPESTKIGEYEWKQVVFDAMYNDYW